VLKTFHTCYPALQKELLPLLWGREERPSQISASQAITKVFLQNDNLPLEIRRHSG
jgi:hypothetical protein